MFALARDRTALQAPFAPICPGQLQDSRIAHELAVSIKGAVVLMARKMVNEDYP
jgi:hypothetical protein